MIFKEDWEKSQERFDAFWENEIIDRCLISVVSRRNAPLETEAAWREWKEPASLEQRWTDAEYIFNRTMYEYSRTYFGGDAFPNFMVRMGPGSPAAFMGAPYILNDRTIWFDQSAIIKDWDDLSMRIMNYGKLHVK